MGEEKKIRRGPSLSFDPDKEKDLIDAVEKLSSSHKLGILMTHLLRLAFESPEVYGNGQEVKDLIAKMSDLGMSPTRYTYFTQISKDIEAMKRKVDTIYDLSYKTYMLAQMGKFLGLEGKSDNNLLASFVLERQLTDLCTTLGVSNLNHSFNSNKLEDVHKKADTIMEFIIESYDSILNELKDSLNLQIVANGQPMLVNATNIDNDKLNGIVGETKTQSEEASEDDESQFIDLTPRPDDTSSDKKKQDVLTVGVISEELEDSFFKMLEGNGG